MKRQAARLALICVVSLCTGMESLYATQHNETQKKNIKIPITINKNLYDHIKKNYPRAFSKFAREAIRQYGDTAETTRKLWTRRKSMTIHSDKNFKKHWDSIRLGNRKERLNALENSLLKKLVDDDNTYEPKQQKKVFITNGGQKVEIVLEDIGSSTVVDTDGKIFRNVKMFVNEEVEISRLSDTPTNTIFFGYEKGVLFRTPIVYVGSSGKIASLVIKGLYEKAIKNGNKFLEIDFGECASKNRAEFYYNVAIAYSRSGNEKKAGLYGVKAREIWKKLNEHDLVDMISKLLEPVEQE